MRLSGTVFRHFRTVGYVINIFNFIVYSLTGPMLMIVVNNIEFAMEVLVKKTTDFAGRIVPPSGMYQGSG